MSSILSYTEAVEILRKVGATIAAGTETVALDDALGRKLATDIQATIDSPPFTNAAMDGFAMKREDALKGPLKIAASIYAQAMEAHEIPAYQPGSCVRIMTGAMVPEWADTVIQVEKATLTGESVSFTDIPLLGASIRRRGEDLQAGALLLKRGTRLDAERIMVCAAFGHARLEVEEDLEIVILSTGDELAEPGTTLTPGTLYNSSRHFLTAAARALNTPVIARDTLRDDAELAAKALEAHAPRDRRRLILTTGAVSAGEKDFLPQVGAQLGFTAHVHKVSIRPGKPVYFATRGKTAWLGLPGNAISTCVGWHFFARPLIHAMTGRGAPERVRVELMNAVSKPADLRCFFRAEVNGAPHNLKAWVGRKQGSAEFAPSIGLEAYVELPEGTASLAAGTSVEALLV